MTPRHQLMPAVPGVRRHRPITAQRGHWRPVLEIRMSQTRIAVIVGSLRRDSFNRKLADALCRMGPESFAFRSLAIGDLPLYNQDDDAQQPPNVLRLKEQ